MLAYGGRGGVLDLQRALGVIGRSRRLELLKDEKTLAQLASEHGVHPNMLREWKTIALCALPGAFEKPDTVAAVQAAHEQQVHELYAEIGQLTTPLNWLKKSCNADTQ